MKQAELPLYIRFGEIPENEMSAVHFSDQVVRQEGGLSVWKAVEVNGRYYPMLPEEPNENAIADYFDFLIDGRDKVLLVTGIEMRLEGACREPLLMDPIIIKDITHYYRNDGKKQMLIVLKDAMKQYYAEYKPDDDKKHALKEAMSEFMQYFVHLDEDKPEDTEANLIDKLPDSDREKAALAVYNAMKTDQIEPGEKSCESVSESNSHRAYIVWAEQIPSMSAKKSYKGELRVYDADDILRKTFSIEEADSDQSLVFRNTVISSIAYDPAIDTVDKISNMVVSIAEDLQLRSFRISTKFELKCEFNPYNIVVCVMNTESNNSVTRFTIPKSSLTDNEAYEEIGMLADKMTEPDRQAYTDAVYNFIRSRLQPHLAQ